MSRCDNCIYPYSDNIDFDVCHICATEKDMYTPVFAPKTTSPIPIILTGDEEWVQKEGKTIGITLKQYREWMQNQGEVIVVTLNPNASVTVDTENKLVICADEYGNKTVMAVTRILKGEDVVWERTAKEIDT